MNGIDHRDPMDISVYHKSNYEQHVGINGALSAKKLSPRRSQR